jgi:6-phosphofructokinase
MTAERKFADAETLTPLMREVFGTDRDITAVDRLLNGTKKGVYRVTLDDATSTIAYVWNADEDYWDGLLPEGHDDPLSGVGVDSSGRPRLGGIGEWVTRQIEDTTGIETRNTVLGHIQRGGAPTGYDRVLATRFGVKAVAAADRGEWGTMVSLRGTDIVLVPLADAVAEPKLLDDDLYDTAEVFFG